MDTVTKTDTSLVTAPAPITVLIVEDNDELRSEIADLLTQDGCRVLLASDGAMALDLLRREPSVDLVLLDLWMPVMDGWSFRATQRHEPGIRDVPVIVLTADDSAPARSIDADAFLRKPFEADGLSAVVRRVVSERRVNHRNGAEVVGKALDVVAGAVGHEVANPLMAIIAWLEQRRHETDVSPDAEVDQVLDQCWRIAETLRTLRALPYPSNERERLVHLDQVVRAVLGGPRSHRLRVECHIDEDATVKGDPLVLLYVCTTLLHHALDAFPRDVADDGLPEPYVSVSVRVVDRSVVLEVTDRGPCIPAEELSQVYTAEYRGRTRGWSIGLRLLYVRDAVTGFGGTMDVANRPGAGVVCRVSLPLANPRSAASSEHGGATPRNGASNASA